MYGFRLADSQTWGIQPGKDTGEWADELARLLGLGPMEGLPDEAIRLERIPSASVPDDGCPRAPRGCDGAGWHIRTSPFLELWRRPAARQIICVLHETKNFFQVKEQMRCALFPVYDLTLRRGGLPLHGALVERDGRGVLLVGRSGVGKSTACRRLPPRWNVLGDDLALAVRRAEGGFAVHPLPTWSAVGPNLEKRAWDVKRGVHLSAVFFLTQAAEDEILPAGRAMATVILADAAMTIFQSVRMKDRSVEKKLLGGNVFANAAAMTKSVPTYILRLSLTGRFWEKIEEVLNRKPREIATRPILSQTARNCPEDEGVERAALCRR
jgi:SynChlorMet cassette protein ScmC